MKLLYIGHLIGNAQLLIFLFAKLVKGKKVNLRDPHILEKSGHSCGGLSVGIESGNDGYPGDNRNPLLQGIAHIFQNDIVIDAGSLLMKLSITMLHVKKQQVNVLNKFLENLMGGKARCLCRTVEGALMGLL